MSSSDHYADQDKEKGKESFPGPSGSSFRPILNTSVILEPPRSLPTSPESQLPLASNRPLSRSNILHEPFSLPETTAIPHTDETVPPQTLLLLLQCPQCVPPKLLFAPTTLKCGHTICSEHVTFTPPTSSATRPGLLPIPACPLPTCVPPVATSFLHPDISLESGVTYFPPPIKSRIPPSPVAGPSRVSEVRLDVTVSKVLALVHRVAEWKPQNTEAIPTLESSDESISDYEDLDQVPNEDIIPNFVPESSPSRPPRLTRKRHGRRPAKRRRRGSQNSPPNQLSYPGKRFSKELLSELTCEICFILLYAPVTTPCQHTFCLKCLQRALDHSAQCPLCRTDLPGFSFFQDHPPNKVVLSLILKVFSKLYADRKSVIEAEERTPTILHIYEPRYRLMIRRCLEKPSPRFGMVIPPRTAGGRSDFGTMLEIRTVQMFPDGRSMVETWGVHRFRILETGSLDGYMVGRVEMIEDFSVDVDDALHASATSPDLDLETLPPALVGGVNRGLAATNEELIALCRSFLYKLRNGTAPWVVQRLNHTYGPEPDDPTSFSFWMALVLPIDEHEKGKLLPIRSPRLRLRLVVHWIEKLNNTWWFSNGCIIG